jgi:uncharacterized cupredoxin-like copper-binding protein
MKRVYLLALVLVGVVLGASAYFLLGQGEETEYTIIMREFSYLVEGGSLPLRLRAGVTYTLNVVNEGVVEHELMIVRSKDAMIGMVHEILYELGEEGLSGEELIEAFEHEHHEMEEAMESQGLLLFEIELEAGEEGVLTVTFDEPGVYWIVCVELEGSLPDTHADLGMVAQIIVEA